MGQSGEVDVAAEQGNMSEDVASVEHVSFGGILAAAAGR